MRWFAHGSAGTGSTFRRRHRSRDPEPQRPVAALQKRCDRLRAGLDLILDQRRADMADLPGGASGLLRQGLQGQGADRLVTRIDPGVILLVGELRGHER